jgi:large subunit ribosomal protein L10
VSKAIKEMQMGALKRTFADVRECVFLSVNKLNSQQDGALRADLRKKNIKVQMVKNSLCRLVFKDLGMQFGDDSAYWKGNTWLAWGPESVAELSRALEASVAKTPALKDRVTIKGAVAEGQPVPFDVAKTMPTRQEAIATILGMVLGPASQIAGQIVGPASQVAGQIQQLAEKKEEGAAA